MKFSEITNRTCLYLLGGIAGMEAFTQYYSDKKWKIVF